MATVAQNRKARHDYNILESFEAGIVLSGQEVKSVKAGEVSLAGSFVIFRGGEAYLTHAYIAPYKKAGELPDYNPERDRKLLLTEKELRNIAERRQSEGLTVVPLEMFVSRNLVKVKIGLVRGKHRY